MISANKLKTHWISCCLFVRLVVWIWNSTNATAAVDVVAGIKREQMTIKVDQQLKQSWLSNDSNYLTKTETTQCKSPLRLCTFVGPLAPDKLSTNETTLLMPNTDCKLSLSTANLMQTSNHMDPTRKWKDHPWTPPRTRQSWSSEKLVNSDCEGDNYKGHSINFHIYM